MNDDLERELRNRQYQKLVASGFHPTENLRAHRFYKLSRSKREAIKQSCLDTFFDLQQDDPAMLSTLEQLPNREKDLVFSKLCDLIEEELNTPVLLRDAQLSDYQSLFLKLRQSYRQASQPTHPFFPPPKRQ